MFNKQNDNRAHASHIFVQFFAIIFCSTMPWQCQILHFIENANKHWQNLFFSFWTWIWSLRIQLQWALPSTDKESGWE